MAACPLAAALTRQSTAKQASHDLQRLISQLDKTMCVYESAMRRIKAENDACSLRTVSLQWGLQFSHGNLEQQGRMERSPRSEGVSSVICNPPTVIAQRQDRRRR